MKAKAQEVHVGKNYHLGLDGVRLFLVDAFPGIPREMRGAMIHVVPHPKTRYGTFVRVEEKQVFVELFNGSEKPEKQWAFPVVKNQHGRCARPNLDVDLFGKIMTVEIHVKIVPQPDDPIEVLDLVEPFLGEGEFDPKPEMPVKPVGSGVFKTDSWSAVE